MKVGKKTLIHRIADQISRQPAVGWQRGSGASAARLRCISFKQYMSMCLYDEKDGYYRSGLTRIGKQGDFYTSSAVGMVLAHCLTSSLFQYAERHIRGDIQLVEWGAGTGRLSGQIQEAWKARALEIPIACHAVVVEDHPGHREEAKLALAHYESPMVLSSEEALNVISGLWQVRPTVVLANELLDAFPVHRVTMEKGKLVELGVAGSAKTGFFEVYMPLSDEQIAASLQSDGIGLAEGQQTEVNLEAGQWLCQLSERMSSGRVIIIDYGHEAKEYTAKHRMKGTLLCYSEHLAADEPYLRVGEQDITAHVPFTSVRKAAEEAGWKVTYYETQKQFLVDNGALELLQNHTETDPFGETARKNRAIRQLLLSDGMSEAFKVLILDK
ncbi:class I SAM-dependent methyltransferase [Paenibacillus sp. YAF4_2]|uniref:class I SAM-dependent methyltransferase n=1 Tax=Paenibacillus sp. YAF4_2 TaxID=3233085 RepID=UPI003F9A847C